MIVRGNVEMHLSLNVYDLETDAIYADRNGFIRVDDPDAFFSDWCDHWINGIGELTGASVDYDKLECDDDEEED